MSEQDVYVCVGTYADEQAAEDDYAAVREQHARGFIGTYDAVIVGKDIDGHVRVHKHEKPTQHGAWTGLTAGAVVGLLFPPALIGSAVVGGVTGGVIGHLWRGLSRHDAKELGELLDEGQAALVVVGRDAYAERVVLAMERAVRKTQRALKVDAKDVDAAVAQAFSELS
jgi:uncharacterized membrane protein